MTKDSTASDKEIGYIVYAFILAVPVFFAWMAFNKHTQNTKWLKFEVVGTMQTVAVSSNRGGPHFVARVKLESGQVVDVSLPTVNNFEEGKLIIVGLSKDPKNSSKVYTYLRAAESGP
ncbi:hypothetical protein R50072_36490 [Simiduia litorea]|uniref:hypothetical protein n=1 Tax=Simiduia litorea TaxID=1435348 RepID=UPI0036F3FD8E